MENLIERKPHGLMALPIGICSHCQGFGREVASTGAAKCRCCGGTGRESSDDQNRGEMMYQVLTRAEIIEEIKAVIRHELRIEFDMEVHAPGHEYLRATVTLGDEVIHETSVLIRIRG